MDPTISSLSSSSDLDGFLVNSGFRAKSRSGSCSSTTSSLVLDREKGELVEATVKLERKGVSTERSIAALKNHSEAERKRRARINAHLDTLRSLVPYATKMDKASLLNEVVRHLKELKMKAAEASEGLLMPMDVDEVTVERKGDKFSDAPYLVRASLCCDCKPEILTDLRQTLDALHVMVMRAEIATFEGRMKTVFAMNSCKDGHNEGSDIQQYLVSSIDQALKSILDKFATSQEFSLKSALSNKRQRILLLNHSLSSLGDLW